MPSEMKSMEVVKTQAAAVVGELCMEPRAPRRVALLGSVWLALLGPVWLALLGPVRAASLDKTFTFSVAAGQQECFSQPMKRDAILEVEFQVIDGGELDINFVAVSPGGLTVARDERKQDNTHSIKAVEDGDYTVCFDNTFSRVSSKTVWMEVMVDDLDVQGDWRSFLSSQQMVDVQVDDLQVSDGRASGRLSEGPPGEWEGE
ncbi:transmembrane emp24 domain-containing protein 5-like isoform X1 [Petromyzon marinus]|uniref:transmembrane emp24 domain-containing protein 5-like isoform X1 n=2 Tax=Petromyzon marinus TaxID=7757 RepID=UPI003F6F3AE7